MKLSALQQSYLNRGSNNSVRGSPPLETSGESSGKSPASILWLLIHATCCLISLFIGFRFSRLVFLLLSSPSSTATTTNLYSGAGDAISGQLHLHQLASNPIIAKFEIPMNRTGSKVVVGRHGIRVRPWPHPDPEEVMKAHRIIERVQKEQRVVFGVKNPKTVIAVTPTYVRTFQKLHLSGVMHSLMLVPYDVVWIVVEAGGVTNETASIVAKSGLIIIHVGFDQQMPISWDDRFKLETRMRIHALR